MARGSGEPPHKMAKLDTTLPTNVIIQFQSDVGETVGRITIGATLGTRDCIGSEQAR